jgi:acetyl/propionyl-CoA carboxylase alpha subunit
MRSRKNQVLKVTYKEDLRMRYREYREKNKFYEIHSIQQIRKIGTRLEYKTIFKGYENDEKEYWLPRDNFSEGTDAYIDEIHRKYIIEGRTIKSYLNDAQYQEEKASLNQLTKNRPFAPQSRKNNNFNRLKKLAQTHERKSKNLQKNKEKSKIDQSTNKEQKNPMKQRQKVESKKRNQALDSREIKKTKEQHKSVNVKTSDNIKCTTKKRMTKAIEKEKANKNNESNKSSKTTKKQDRKILKFSSSRASREVN